MPEAINQLWLSLMCRVEDAPVQPGVISGPWLSITDDRKYWLIEWTGDEFATLQGARCRPVALWLLPPIPGLLPQILSALA